MEKANLCTCNNCGNIFLDQNPRIGAKVFQVNLSKVTALQYISEADDMTDPQRPTKSDSNSYFWGCPICETDGYLTDEVNEDEAKKREII